MICTAHRIFFGW